jgi:hypothetical protein
MALRIPISKQGTGQIAEDNLVRFMLNNELSRRKIVGNKRKDANL